MNHADIISIIDKIPQLIFGLIVLRIVLFQLHKLKVHIEFFFLLKDVISLNGAYISPEEYTRKVMDSIKSNRKNMINQREYTHFCKWISRLEHILTDQYSQIFQTYLQMPEEEATPLGRTIAGIFADCTQDMEFDLHEKEINSFIKQLSIPG